MLARSAYKKLEEWKRLKGKQGLLITGARQVGKTTLVREFASKNYGQTIEVSFLSNPQAIEAVSGAANTKDLLFRLSALSQAQIVPGDTLLFLDEIQACEDALTWVKFLEEAVDVDIILSGSLLGVNLRNVRSVPVGFLGTMRMYPMAFLEFCEATGVPGDVTGVVREAFAERRPLDAFFHEYFTDLFYKYLLVGGMPDAVQAYVNENSLPAVRARQQFVVDTYRMDITKYVEDETDKGLIASIYDAIPNQLDKENKRFKFAKIEPNASRARFSYFKSAFDWLANAGTALLTMRVGEPACPLGLSADTGAFKLYMNDVGLLTSRLMRDVDFEILNRRSSMNFGSIFENAVAQELFAAGHELYYYNRKGTGEVDFVLQDSRGDVSLVEVKSGKDYKRHHALGNLLATKNYAFAHAYVLYDGNLSVEDGVEYLPVYMAGLL